MKISIIILSYNGISDHLKETLDAVFMQKTDYTFEILVIDSGSVDGTIEFLRENKNLRLHQIPNSEFGHSKTRQLGAELVDGDIAVFLTQDAVPMDNLWLQNLVENFSDKDVVGVCSRVLPRRDANVLKKIEVMSDLSARSERIEAQLGDNETDSDLSFGEKRRRYYFFNDVSSAIRRKFLLENPFPDVEFAEDVEFAKVALSKGKRIVFEPTSAVLHSHKYEILKTYKRNFVDAIYHREFLGVKSVPSFYRFIFNILYLIRRDIIEIDNYGVAFFEKLKAFAYSPVIHFAEQLGQYNGSNKK